MKKLILTRHAQAIPASPLTPSNSDDFNRPLSEYGVAQANLLAEKFPPQHHPDLILSSNAVRTTQTKDIISGKICNNVELIPQLYMCEAEDILHIIETTDNILQTLMIIAHNPSLQDLAFNLADESGVQQLLQQGFSPCTTIILAVEGNNWNDISAQKHRIIEFIIPKP